MKNLLNKLFEHQRLSRAEAYDALTMITRGEANEAQIAAFLTVYLMRSISIEELDGFRQALLDLCVPFDLGGLPAVDLCGTGGDGKNTFNISTLASFVVAGAGGKVVNPKTNEAVDKIHTYGESWSKFVKEGKGVFKL